MKKQTIFWVKSKPVSFFSENIIRKHLNMKKQITFQVISKLLFSFADIYDQKHKKTKQQTIFCVKSKPHISFLHNYRGKHWNMKKQITFWVISKLLFYFFIIMIRNIRKQNPLHLRKQETCGLLLTLKLVCCFVFSCF